MSGWPGTRRVVAFGVGVGFATFFFGVPPAGAGPDPEPSPSQFDIAFPGSHVMPPRARRRVVVRVRFENVGESDSAGLDVCAILPPGFHDASVSGERDRVRVTQAGAKICWFAGVFGSGDSERAVVRATAPRKPGHYVTRVRLIAVENAASEGETLTETGAVTVRR